MNRFHVHLNVADLAARGIKFEHYPDMGMDYRDGVHSAGNFKAVWLKDPDGNILHLISRPQPLMIQPLRPPMVNGTKKKPYQASWQ